MTKTEPKYVPRKYLSVSTLLKFIRCPRMYYYQKSGLCSQEDPPAPVFGTCMHNAIPVALMTGDVEAGLMAFMSEWNEDIGDDKRNTANARRILSHFIHTHKDGRSIYTLLSPPPNALRREDSRSQWEVPWAIDIGLDIPLVGVFDGFCTHRDIGGKWVWELKTASRVNETLIDQFDMNMQVLTYALVGQTILQEPVHGVMVEMILVDKKKVDNIVQPIPVQPHHLESVLRLLRYKGQELLNMERHALELESRGEDSAKAFIQDFSHCTAYSHFYYPSYQCEFKELCRVTNWRDMTDIFRVKEDHDFVNLTIENALRPVIQPV